MLKNYFITGFRAISRNVSYTFFNVFGLTLGVASCLIIFLVVKNELSFDAFNKKADRTYRVTFNALDFNANVSVGLLPAMRNYFPEIENATQIFYEREALVKVGNTRYNEKNITYADDQFTSVFDYDWLAGNPKTALRQPNTVVLTQTYAHKYFGDKEALGQVITVDNQNTFKVTGVIKDVPPNTHLPFNFLMSYETVRVGFLKNMSHIYAIPGGSYAYIVLPKGYAPSRIESRVHGLIEKNWGKEIANDIKQLPLQPLKDIHFDQRYINNIITPTSKDTYWALAGVAVLIIITACINFVNLATTQAIKRGKEVGVRKVLGAKRSQLVKQFLGEASLLVIISVVLAYISAIFFLPVIAAWLNINISNSLLFQPPVLLLLVALTIVLILFAGLYPAFVQSAFRPVDTLKGNAGVSLKGIALRKGLVLVQFAITQVMIVGTLVVAAQMNFFQNQDLGFVKDATITVGIPNSSKREVLRQQLMNNPGVTDVSFSSAPPPYETGATSVSAPKLGITKDDVTEIKFVDDNYLNMFGIAMLAGSKIHKVAGWDSTPNVVVNETLINKIGIQNPQAAIGQHIVLNGGMDATITGVAHDFQSESKHKKRRPCVMLFDSSRFYYASVKLQMASAKQTIDRIDKDWSALFPDDLFSYQFLDDHIAEMYTQEQKVYTAFKLFAGIAILIGCLGLYGLVAFAAVQRTKEVGVRKVLGASLTNIVYLFAKEFLILIAVAFLLAAPTAYYVMSNWLSNFAYQVSIGAGIFVISIAVSVAIAAVTIAQQAIKAALANPIKSLRTE
jgi:ABC-type antimicrobial peptide transport system permease subunit